MADVTTMPSRAWRDAMTMRRSFICLRSNNHLRWTEVRDECRRSKRFRRWWLKTCRADAMFNLHAIWNGVTP